MRLQGFPERLLKMGAAGIILLQNSNMGVLLPQQHPGRREVLLRLVIVPNATAPRAR